LLRISTATGRSYGLNVARLADIPAELLVLAGEKSQELEREVQARRRTAAAADAGPLSLATLLRAVDEGDEVAVRRAVQAICPEVV
jgi:DNA mismatch repair ATPase MutS